MILALAQINPIVSDLTSNRDRIIAEIRRARAAGADVVLFPELCLCGYPPKDLLLKPRFIAAMRLRLDEIAAACGPDITAFVGFAEANTQSRGRPLFNAVASCRNGAVTGIYHKTLLPTYDVFDESRYFEPGSEPNVVFLESRGGSVRAGVTICEDLWNDADYVTRPLYHANPIEVLAEEKPELI